MVAGQPVGKIQLRVGLEIVLLDAVPKILPGTRPDGFVRLVMDLDLRPLQDGS